jgi:hypothetical protein
MPLGRESSRVTSDERPAPPPVDAVERELLGRVGVLPAQAVRRVGEVQVAVGAERHVVGAVEPPPLEAVGEHGLGEGALVEPRDLAVAVVGHDERSGRVEA